MHVTAVRPTYDASKDHCSVVVSLRGNFLPSCQSHFHTGRQILQVLFGRISDQALVLSIKMWMGQNLCKTILLKSLGSMFERQHPSCFCVQCVSVTACEHSCKHANRDLLLITGRDHRWKLAKADFVGQQHAQCTLHLQHWRPGNWVRPASCYQERWNLDSKGYTTIIQSRENEV